MQTEINGCAVRAIRQRSGIRSAAALARLVSDQGFALHEASLRNIEIGARRASPDVIKAIADVLQVPTTAITHVVSDTPQAGAA